MTDIAGLVERLEAATGPDNALDMEIEMALFKPDERHVSVRANAAGTKLIYTRADGKTDTHWAFDHTLNAFTQAAARAELRALLKALEQKATAP